MTKRNPRMAVAMIMCVLLLAGCTNKASGSSDTQSVTDISSTADTSQVDGSASTTDSSSTTTEDSSTSDISTVTAAADLSVTFDKNDYYSNEIPQAATIITLKKTSVNIEGSGAAAVGTDITISTAGIYVLSGSLENGQIIINVGDKDDVQLILNNASLHCSDSAPIYVQNADKVQISLPAGTNNTLSDTANYVLTDTEAKEPNATLFSKTDLVINGTGTLTVEANYNNAIVSKDDLKITEATLKITSVDDGILGRDSFAAKDAKITVKAEGDGLKSTNTEDVTNGFVLLDGGKYIITAGTDGIQAATTAKLNNANITIVTGGGSVNAIAKQGGQDDNRGMWGVDKSTTDTSAATTTEDSTPSTKGIKSSNTIIISGGTITIDSSDDSLHSGNLITISSGILDLTSGDDGIHADGEIAILDGTITINKSYEGIESTLVTVNMGTIKITSSDDGFNISGGDNLTINGGNIYVNASGDGLDSNGNIYLNGGTIIVNGPTNDGNAALDYQNSCEITGGNLIAAGSSGMAQTPGEQSSQYSFGVLFTQTQAAGTLVHVEDSYGKTIATFAPAKQFASVVISSPNIKKGETYTIYSGGSSTGTSVNGNYSDGTYTTGTKLVEFTVTNVITWVNESGITEHTEAFGGGGGGGGMKGGMDGGKRGSRGNNDGTMTPPDVNSDGAMMPPDANSGANTATPSTNSGTDGL